eukprot:13157019-Heterocapsa_arctica.AAC.1
MDPGKQIFQHTRAKDGLCWGLTVSLKLGCVRGAACGNIAAGSVRAVGTACLPSSSSSSSSSSS